MKTKIYPVNSLWCLQWQTLSMPAPAFWYYNSEEDAKEVNLRLQRTAKLLNLK